MPLGPAGDRPDAVTVREATADDAAACARIYAHWVEHSSATFEEVPPEPDELARRRAAWRPRDNGYGSGALWRYAQTVGPAYLGAITHPGARAESHVYADI